MSQKEWGIVYAKWLRAIENLSCEERGKIEHLIFQCVLDQEYDISILAPTTKAVFDLIKSDIDSDGQKVAIAKMLQSKTNVMKTIAPVKDKLDYSFIDETWLPLVMKWLSYKKARKETYVQIGLQAFYTKLRHLSNDDLKTAEAIIDQSMANSWKGIFELRDYGTTSRQLKRNPRENILQYTGETSSTVDRTL